MRCNIVNSNCIDTLPCPKRTFDKVFYELRQNRRVCLGETFMEFLFLLFYLALKCSKLASRGLSLECMAK